MSETNKKFYLTTPIYYVNARPHIGHAYSTIAADVIARRHRLLGDDTFFLTGTDEHGQKVQRSAATAGIPPQQFTDEVSATFRNLWKRMGITNNDFIRTTEPRHIQGVQRLWRLLEERGFIYLSTYTGQYSVGEEMFVDGPPGTIGPDGKPTETVTEENYFFKLSEFQKPLLDFYEANPNFISPAGVRNEVLSFVRGNLIGAAGGVSVGDPGPLEQGLSFAEVNEGLQQGKVKRSSGGLYVPGALKDLSISRTTFDWGIPVPGNEKHVIYVWLDALSNYMTAIGYGSDDPAEQAKFKKYWPADIHLVGKEITRFHCVYWPAFLMAAGLPLPKSVVANGWLLFEESKMSKSRGNIVRTETILDAFGTLLPKPTEAVTPSTEISSSGTTGSTAGNTGSTTGSTSTTGTTGTTGSTSTTGISTGLQPGELAANEKGALAPGLSPADVAWKHEQDLFASDVLRYFLLREIPFGQDGSFSFDALVQRYNSDLANGYGNLVSRTLNMIEQYFAGTLASSWLTKEQFSIGENLLGDSSLDFEPNNLTRTTKAIVSYISALDVNLSEQAPWKLAKKEDSESRKDLEVILYQTAESIRIITALLYPVMPYATAKVWAQLGLGDIEADAKAGKLKNLQWGGLEPGTKLGPLSPIFPRAPKELIQLMTDMETDNAKPAPSKLTGETAAAATDPISTTDPAAPPRTTDLTESNPGAQVGGAAAPGPDLVKTPPHTESPASGAFATSQSSQPNAQSPQIAIDDFVKIDLRVAKIIVAERIPKADKLLRLEVDLGYEKRQILSGIAEWYTPEELIGRRIVVISNLAPRKMRGLESHGMLLAASEGENGKPILATFGEEIALGSRLK